MLRRSRPAVFGLALLVVVLASACGQAGASSPPPVVTGPVAVTNTIEAHDAASALWGQRETALASLDVTKLAVIETKSALQMDSAYVDAVQCGCKPQIDGHPAKKVIVQIPKKSVQPVFFAEIDTTNTGTNRHPWYVLAIARDKATWSWRIAYVTFGGYGAAPPLRKLTKSAGLTPAVTDQSVARMGHLADLSVHYAMTHNKLTGHTSYGATIRRKAEVKPAKDGLYGLQLPSGNVLSCYTMHSLVTYSDKSGLRQSASREQWGDLLAQGTYKSITTDNAQTECVVGKGVGKNTGKLWLQYTPQLLSTTGVIK